MPFYFHFCYANEVEIQVFSPIHKQNESILRLNIEISNVQADLFHAIKILNQCNEGCFFLICSTNVFFRGYLPVKFMVQIAIHTLIMQLSQFCKFK